MKYFRQEAWVVSLPFPTSQTAFQESVDLSPRTLTNWSKENYKDSSPHNFKNLPLLVRFYVYAAPASLCSTVLSAQVDKFSLEDFTISIPIIH